jgi:hypothetical protein
MPNRYIRQAAIESESVNSLSWQGEVFYRRLLNRADDFGRFTASIPLLRASIFPLQLEKVRDADISRLLAECEMAGLLFVYAIDVKRFLVLNKWEQGRAKSSEYPPPPPNISERMRTYVYTCSHMHPTPTPTPTPITDADSDTDTDNKAALPEPLQNEAFSAKWEEFVKYRKESRFRALKPASVSKLLNELAGWGSESAIEAIDTTIRNGWQGIFQPKVNQLVRPNGTNPHQRAAPTAEDHRRDGFEV